MTSYTEVFDVGNNFSGGVFTAPYDCVMQVNASVALSDYIGRNEIRIMLNNSDIVAQALSVGTSNTHDPAAAVSICINLNAGDNLRVIVFVDSAGGGAFRPGSQFSGFMVAKL